MRILYQCVRGDFRTYSEAKFDAHMRRTGHGLASRGRGDSTLRAIDMGLKVAVTAPLLAAAAGLLRRH